MLFGPLGPITSPLNTISGGAYAGPPGSGLITILSNFVRFAIVMAGVYAFINLVLAGYGFLSAGGDTKAISKAWEKIWQTLLGLMIVAGSFVLAAIFSFLVFGNSQVILNPPVYGP